MPLSLDCFCRGQLRKVTACSAERSSKKCAENIYEIKKLKNNIKAACGLMRNRPDRLNCPGPSSPQFQHTMTGQEIDNVIAYFGANLGQFVTPWQHVPSPWIALLSIQKALNLTDRNEFCLAILEKNERQKKAAWNVFHLGSFTGLKHKHFPLSFRQERNVTAQLGKSYKNLSSSKHACISTHFHVCIVERCGRVYNCVVSKGGGSRWPQNNVLSCTLPK